MSAVEQKIGRYQLLDPVGRGAMGIVYRAEDPLIHRTVAVKVLHPATGLDPQQVVIARERFRREAQAAGSLDHPHIIRILDVGEEQHSGEMYIVMEYLPGPSLEAMLDGGDLDSDAAVEIIGQIAAGLDAAHEQGIVHRDVKPSNILFTDRGVAKIVDFGITQIASSSLTQDLSKLGTPAYMSPEQIAGTPLDFRADLFSLGVLSYEILTGTKPFVGPDMVSIAYAITHADPVPISKVNRLLPPSLDRVFALMLSKDPADRFASGKSFHEAVVRCLGEGAGLRSSERIQRSNRRRLALLTLCACGLLAAIAVPMVPRAQPQPIPKKAASVAPAPATAAPAAAPARSSGRPAARASTPRAARPTAPQAVPPSAPPAVRPSAPPVSKAVTPAPMSQVTISLTHRVRRGSLTVWIDSRPIFIEKFSKAPLAISQTTRWDPLTLPAGKHKLKARVISDDGTTYESDAFPIDIPRASEAEVRIRIKGDRLTFQQS